MTIVSCCSTVDVAVGLGSDWTLIAASVSWTARFNVVHGRRSSADLPNFVACADGWNHPSRLPGSEQPVLVRVRGRGGSRRDAQLGKDIAHVPVDCPLAQDKLV